MEKSKFLRKNLVIIIIAIIAIIVGSIIMRYSVEGEENLPFQVSKIMVISNASGIQRQESQYKWDLNVVQNNDIYIDILKNKNYNKEEIIDKVIFSNFEINEKPKKGEVTVYSSASLENGIYNNEEQYKITDTLEYIGNEEKSDMKNLQISNQGGLILLRVVNENLGTYTSNEDEEIRHDGTLLGKLGLTNEDVTFTISFDLSIELKSDKNYKAKVTLELPKGNLATEGTTNYQISGTEELVFKRY
ncbi:MAG: hypothetical protein J6A04_07670 [Clostridia bacterium]|nr:hypothetical protein [Clostridia bacterium]